MDLGMGGMDCLLSVFGGGSSLPLGSNVVFLMEVV